jgi:hypothetical protein
LGVEDLQLISHGREILREESDGGKWRKAREWKIIIKNEIAWGWSAINMEKESDKSHFGETIASLMRRSFWEVSPKFGETFKLPSSILMLSLLYQI